MRKREGSYANCAYELSNLPNTYLLIGINVKFKQFSLKVRLLIKLSSALTMNGIGCVGVFTVVA